jgi:flagellar motor switch protein FliN/FliY
MSRATEPVTPDAAPVAAGAPVSPSAAPRPEGFESAAVQEVHAQKASFPRLESAPGTAGAMPLGFLMDVTVTLTAELGRTTITLGEVLQLGSGAVVPLDRLVAEPVEITARGVLLARGEVVIVDDRFAVRIKEIVQPRQAPAGGEAG